MGNKKEIDLLPDQPLGEKLIKKGFWLYFFTLLIAPTGYLVRVLISNSVGVAEVGIIYSIMGLMGIISAYHDLWLTEALQYHLPKYWIKKQYNAFKTSILFTFIIQTITWLIIAFILFFWADFLATHYFHSLESANIIKIFSLYFLGINIFNMLYSIYIAFQDVIQYKLIEWIKSYTTLVFTICFFILGTLSITNFTRAWIIGLLVSLMISGVLFIKKYGYTLNKWKLERDNTLLKKQMKYAFRIFIGINVSFSLLQIDQQFIIYFMWAKAAGYYANYLSLVMSFSVIVWPILWYIFPLTTELIEKKQYNKIKELKNTLYKYFSLFAISISWLFLVFGPEIATILFGEKFIYSGQLLTYSSVFLVFYMLYGINIGFLAGMGKVKQRAKIIFIALIVNIILNMIFIQIWWIIGVIVATIISWIMLFYMSYKLINKNKEIYFDRLFLLKNIASITILCTILYYYKDKVFILEDWHRYKNLLYLVLISVWYYILIIILNYKSIFLLRKKYIFKRRILK